MQKSQLSRFKKSIIGVLMVSALILSSVGSAFAYYKPLGTAETSSADYEGSKVQRTIENTSMWDAPPPAYGVILMNMSANEAFVNCAEQMWSGYRLGIVGWSPGGYMVEGYVYDLTLQVVRENVVRSTSRVALAARDSAGVAIGGTDIPAGVELSYSTDGLRAYKDGSMVLVDGYYASGSGSWIYRPCYVNTNWASGSVGSYYVQFTTK